MATRSFDTRPSRSPATGAGAASVRQQRTGSGPRWAWMRWAWMRGAGAGWALLCAGCTLPSLEPRGPRVEFSSLPPEADGPQASAEPSAALELSPVALRPLLLWRGEPLAIEFADPPEDGTDLALAPAWVLFDLELESAGGRVDRAHLRSNGERLIVPFGALHLAAPGAPTSNRPRVVPRSAAWWAAALQSQGPAPAPNPVPEVPPGQGQTQNGGDNPERLADRHSSLFGERQSERLEGDFHDSEASERSGQALVVSLRSANNHYHRLSLAPGDWLAARQARPVAGDRLVVRGVRTRDSKGALFVARELELRTRTIVLRGEDGIPHWTPVPEPEPEPAPVPQPQPQPPAEPAPGSGAGDGEGSPETGTEAPPAEVSAPAEESNPIPAAPEAAVAQPPPPEPLVRDGRLSAQALLALRLNLPSAPGAGTALAVRGLVLDLERDRVGYFALRATADGEESWLWIPWEALEWPDGHPRLLPAASEGSPPSAGIDARTQLPSDQALERARRYWLGG